MSTTLLSRGGLNCMLLLFSTMAIFQQSLSQSGFENEIRWSTQIGGTNGIVGDFDGNGMADICYYAGGDTFKVMLSGGTFFWAAQPWALGQGVNSGLWAGDFNGDGITDKITYVHSSYPANEGFWVALSGRETDWPDTTVPYYRFYPEYNWTDQTVYDPQKIRIGDFNGDGMDDIAYFQPQSSQWHVLVCEGGTETLSGRGYFYGPMLWIDGVTWNDGTWVGDFDGDGMMDILVHTSGNDWKVMLSTGTSFQALSSPWANTVCLNSDVVVGDFNGDSKSDVAYHTSSGDGWYVMTSSTYGNFFNSPQPWAWGQGMNNGVWAGDFNGDGLCDKVTYANASGYGWYVAKTNDTREREVGVWYYAGQNCNPKDSLKTPVAGWGPDRYEEIYDCADTFMTKRQFTAMRSAGIDFVIFDLTNGVGTNNETQSAWPGSQVSQIKVTVNLPVPSLDVDEHAFAQTYRIIKWMQETSADIPKFVVGFGLEFWGKNNDYQNPLIGDPWEDQKLRQGNAVDWVKNNWITHPKYHTYLGRPLIVIDLHNFKDYPWRNQSWGITNRVVFPGFTVRYGAEWPATYADWKTTRYQIGEKYIEGMNTKRLWNWGAGAKDGEYVGWQLPTSTECMSIMPGTHYWTRVPDELAISRGPYGEFYIDSWKQVIAAMPKKVLIADWSNWAEEVAIEGCVGPNGWKNYQNSSQYDWYLQITQAYSSIFKWELIPEGTYVRDESEESVWLMDGGSLVFQGNWYPPEEWRPVGKPVIVLPQGWLDNHKLGKQAALDNANPIQFAVEQNYPNPFNPSTTIRYALPHDTFVSLTVYNTLGQQVAQLVDRQQKAGNHDVVFRGAGLASGVYFYRIQAGEFAASKKLLLLK